MHDPAWAMRPYLKAYEAYKAAVAEFGKVMPTEQCNDTEQLIRKATITRFTAVLMGHIAAQRQRLQLRTAVQGVSAAMRGAGLTFGDLHAALAAKCGDALHLR